MAWRKNPIWDVGQWYRVRKTIGKSTQKLLRVLLLSILLGGGCRWSPVQVQPPQLTTAAAPPSVTATVAPPPTVQIPTPMPTQKVAGAIALAYIDRFDLRKADEDIREPSGLTWMPDGTTLWTVSDDNRRIFPLTTTGDLLQERSFRIEPTGLEGIALDGSGNFLYVVQEEENEIFKVDLAAGATIMRRQLRDMAGYDQVAADFAQGGTNKGLEGIAWHSKRGSWFVLKEGEPGLLLELTASLDQILEHRLLSADNGFVDDDTSSEKLDFSGLFYDATDDLFWIVSDQGQRLFLYDWQSDSVVQSVPLRYERNGKPHEIEKAEGVAYDEVAQRLYVVSDAEARLYVFAVTFQ